MALVPEGTSEGKSKEWYAFLLNEGKTPIETVLIVSEGYDESRKTSRMRHSISVLPANSYAKIELVQEDVLALNNVFFVTYFADNKLYEKRFLFSRECLSPPQLVLVPLLKKDGIFVK